MTCPECGKRHRPGTLIGFSLMNRKCAAKHNARVAKRREKD